jgi:hypothetical protein
MVIRLGCGFAPQPSQYWVDTAALTFEVYL